MPMKAPASVPDSARRWTPPSAEPAAPSPRERVEFLMSLPETAPDEYKQAAARQISAMLKVPDPDGRMWRKDRRPFATGSEYLDFMRGMRKSGDIWEYAADDELKAFYAADDAGRLTIARAARGIAEKAGDAAQGLLDKAFYADGAPELKDAPEDVLAANARLRADAEAAARHNAAAPSFAGTFRPLPEPERPEAAADRKALDAWRARRRDEELVAEHGAKLLDRNLWAVWLGVAPSLSEKGRQIAEGAVRGRKLSGGDIAAFQRLDEKEQAAVAKLARLSRDPKAGTFWNTLGDAGIGFLNGVVSLPANAAEQAARNIVTVAEAVFGKDAGLIDNAEMNRRERERLRLEEALDDSAGIDPSGADHGYLARSLIGFASTIPYMGYASMGAAGTAGVALDFMQRLDDHVAAEGGDVYGRGLEYTAQKLVYGALYTAVERVQAAPIFGPRKGFADSLAFMKLATRHGAAAAQKVAAHWGKETCKETLEESVQAVIEEHAASVGLRLGPGWREAVRAGVGEFGETALTMAMAAGAGTVRQGIRARSERGRSDIYAQTMDSLRRNSFILSDNPYAGRAGAADVIAAADEAARRMGSYRADWTGGGLAALEKRADLTAEDAALLAHVFEGEAGDSEIGKLIAGRNMWTRTPEGSDGHGGVGDLTLDTAYALWKDGGPDRSGRLAAAGFTEAGAARIDRYFAAADKVRDRVFEALAGEMDGPGQPAARRAAVRDRLEIQPMREVYQRAGTRQGAVKAFKELRFTQEQAENLAAAFDEERAFAASPEAAAAWRAAYLDASREATPGERLRRMTGFEARPAPEAGEGASLLTLRGPDGKPRGEILLQPDTAETFDPESRFAGEAVEQASAGKPWAVTERQWQAFTPEQRRAYAAEYIRPRGGFTVTDPADPSVSADGAQADILTGKIAISPDAQSATLYHEAAHAWLAVMRRAGKITEADIAKLREAYGPSAADPQWFNEEALADDIREIGAETDYAPDKPLARRFIAAVRRLAGAARAEESRRTAASGARQALYESIVYGKPFEGVGDFAAVPKPADPAGEGKASADPIAGASTAQAATGDGQQETGDKQPETRNQKPETRNPEPETKNQKPEAGRWTAATPQGNLRVGGHWVIAPRDRFISDTDPRYDFSLQNRTRDAALGSAEQVAEIVAKFDALRLLDSPDTANGAPLAVPVTLKGADGKNETFYMVLSGNGRFRALDQLDADHRGDEYRKPIQTFADARGIPYEPADLTEDAHPRLVRVMTRVPAGATRQRIAELSNQNAVLQMTDAERAYSDAALIERDGTADLYAANRDGLPSRNGSDAFFAWFTRAAGDASLMDSQGRPTDAARARARRAMLALAVGRGRRGKETVMAFTEQAEALGLDRQRDALLMSAGALSALGEAKPDYALADEMSRAAADLLMLARERKAGKAVTAAEFIAQGDMLDAMPPAAAEALRILDAARPAEGIAAAFQRYADLAAKIDTSTDDMFGVAPAAKEELLRKAVSDTDVKAPSGPRYSIALAARRYALATGMPAEGERLMARQLEFLFARHMDPAYIASRARAAETRRAKAAAAERRKAEARRDAHGRALANPDDPQAWAEAFAASEDGTVSRIAHDFFMGGGGPQRFPHAYGGKPLYGTRVNTPRDAAALLMPLRNPYQESFKAIFLDDKRRVLGAEVCTLGLLDSAPVHPRETFRRGIELGASQVILAHNHPSGNPAPSKENRDITRRLDEAAKVIGLQYIDHIITDGGKYYSLASDSLESLGGPAKADWEAVAAGGTRQIRDPDTVAALARVLRQGADNVIHAVLLDTKNRITAVKRIPIDPARIADPAYQDETVTREALRAAVANPTAAIILEVTDRAVTPEAARGLHARAEQQARTIGIQLHDTLYLQGGWSWSAKAGERVMPMEADAAAEPAAPRYSLAVTPEQDAEYMLAVEAGDAFRAARLLHAAASDAGMSYKNGRYEPSAEDLPAGAVIPITARSAKGNLSIDAWLTADGKILLDNGKTMSPGESVYIPDDGSGPTDSIPESEIVKALDDPFVVRVIEDAGKINRSVSRFELLRAKKELDEIAKDWFSADQQKLEAAENQYNMLLRKRYPGVNTDISSQVNEWLRIDELTAAGIDRRAIAADYVKNEWDKARLFVAGGYIHTETELSPLARFASQSWQNAGGQLGLSVLSQLNDQEASAALILHGFDRKESSRVIGRQKNSILEKHRPADIVLRDDAGRVIPLSERFNAASPDNRYSLEAVTPARDAAYLTDEDANEQLKAMRERWAAEGVESYAYASKGDITLHEIRIPKQQRGSGIGTAKMTELLAFAQAHKMRVVLTPSTDFGATSKARLVSFYRRLGFEKNAGRNKDYRTREAMIWRYQGYDRFTSPYTRYSLEAARASINEETLAQTDAVRAEHHHADGTAKPSWLKAPNGKPTNLTERQWLQVRTPSFKAWFGDWENNPAEASKVVDANGEPMVLYHGTSHDFSTFDMSQAGKHFDAGENGAFFTNNTSFRVAWMGRGNSPMRQEVINDMGSAGAYANESARQNGGAEQIMPVFLNLRNPLILREDSDGAGIFSLFERSYGIDIDVKRQMEDQANDGLLVTDTGYVFEKGQAETVAMAFRPEQIKSATANTGAFSPASTDIRHALDLTGRAYSKENLLVGFMAHAELTGRGFPSRGTVAALAEKIGLENHRYDELARRARALAASTEDDAIRKAAASADPGNAAYAIGELARRAERALVRAGAAEGARLARSGERIRALSEEGVRRAMQAVTGADYADIETDTDIDVAASILAADPKAFDEQRERARAEAAGVLPGAPADADPAAPADPASPGETDEDAPELTDRQRAEIARKRREREARIQALLDAARGRAARNRSRDEERRRRKAANEKAEAEEEAAAAASGAGDAGGTDAASAPAPAAPGAEETGPAAPVDFTDRWEAAAFLRVWAFDRFRRDNPNRRDTGGDLSRNRVAVEFYRKTAVRELTDLARKLLAPGAPRETVRAMIGDIVPGLTANQIERRTAHVFGVINRHAVRERQRSLVKKFRAEIKRQYIKGKEFEEMGVDLGRALTGAIEEDARYIMRVCELSDRALDGETSALQEERNRLNAVIAQREGMTDEKGNPLDVGNDDMASRRALRQLALLDTYGAMVDMMPGEILDLTGDALATLGREAVELRRRWEAYDALVKSIRDPLVRSIARGVDDPAASESVWNAVADSQLSMLRQRLDFLTRYEKDPAKREAARAAISDLMDLLARGNVEYTNAVADDRAALMGALGQIFRRDDGRPDRKKIRAYLRRLDERVPRELAARLTRQGRQNGMTYGQMLHLLAYLDQWASYKDNIIRHDRRGQAALIRSFVFEDPKTGEARRALTNEDTQLVEWLRRAHYAGKRGAISAVTQRLAGRGVDSPDPLYHPVKMLLSRTSALAAAPGGEAWQPMAGAFSRRVRNSLDVDETASILDLFHSRSHDTAVLTAFGERGMVIREALTSRGFQDAVRRFHGDRALSKILRQVAQSLDGGRARGGGQSAAASMAQRLTTYMYLGFNPHSAAKQSASLPVFAARLGFRRLGSILFSPIDRAAVRRLRASDEYRARYGTGPASGMNAADRAAYDAPDADPLKKVFGDWGLWMTRKTDWIISAWVGQGVYRDLKATYIDRGMAEAEADRRAISETFTLIEETQQSGRSENLPEMSREHGFLGRLMVQFATSPLQQMQYEIKELAEWRDLAANGGPAAGIREARNRFMRAAFINHVLVPGIMAGISGLYKAATGDEPDWQKEGYWHNLLIAAIMGQFGRIFFAGALAEQTLRVLFLRKPPYMGQLVPAEGVIRFAGNLAYPVRDIVTWDTEHMQADIMRLLKSIALTRLPVKIYEARAGDE